MPAVSGVSADNSAELGPLFGAPRGTPKRRFKVKAVRRWALFRVNGKDPPPFASPPSLFAPPPSLPALISRVPRRPHRPFYNV